MVDVQLDALSVGTRRAIYTMLLERPRSVGDIADHLPVSRPAVSQHLKVLLDADLAQVTSVGTRRVYAANPAGIAALRDWIDRMWDMAMGSFADFARREMENEMSSSDRLEPVIKVMTIPGSPTVVFELFTDRMTEWWPLESHSIGEKDAVGVRVEPGVGGRVVETTRDGAEHEWAHITGWEPGERLKMDWYPGLPASQATHLEITFRQTADGTELTLVHDGWEARGADAVRMREGYETGWDLVLGRIPGATALAKTSA